MTPFDKHPRRWLTKMERAQLFAAVDGRCQECGRKLGVGDDWDIDHIIALSKGGTNEDSNLRVLCGWCHAAKSADDTSDAAKSKRVYANHVVPSRHRARTAWRWGRR